MSSPSIATVEAISASLYVFAISSTTLRLARRHSLRLLWWDDAFAATAVFFSTLSLIGVFAWDSLGNSNAAHLAFNWIMTFSFTNALWLARISMMLSLVRLIPPVLSLRSYCRSTAYVLPCFWLSLVIHKSIVCSRPSQNLTIRICRQDAFLALHGLITGLLTDAALCFFPLRMFWVLSERKAKYRVLLVLFSASLVTAAVGIVHGWAALDPSGGAEGITSNIESASAVIVCNLAIIYSWIIRILGLRDQGREMEAYVSMCLVDDTPSNWSTRRMTTSTKTLMSNCIRVLLNRTTSLRGRDLDHNYDLENQRSRSPVYEPTASQSQSQDDSKGDVEGLELPVAIMKGGPGTTTEDDDDCLSNHSLSLKASMRNGSRTTITDSEQPPSPLLTSPPSPTHVSSAPTDISSSSSPNSNSTHNRSS